MVTVYDLKQKFQNLLRPAVSKLAEKGYTPNQLTWAALLLSILSGVFLALSSGAALALICIPFILFIRMALNAMDGMLAKEHDMKSDNGAILNEISDIISDIAIYLPFALIAGVSNYYVVFFVIAAMLTEVVGILGWAVKHERRFDGPMGKSDRAVIVGIISLLLGCGVEPGG
ncbi:MAG: CDP-alcohol phosphatidyltransferase family protein, partial [Thiotrichaceae bacterium]|nr:CDP-alcohol phosphatidyltransferase family protein [Thiotrichaceae bacterium]